MRTTTVVIGAGQAGLAMSRCLAERSIDHVVLERGEVANSWRTERWDSLRLLTPNWQSRLPGYGYQGDDPDGFRTMPETIAFIERYARVIAAPVRTHTRVDFGAAGGRRLRGRDRPRQLAMRDGRARHRRVQRRQRAGDRRGRAAGDRDADADAVPQSGSARSTAACWSSAPRPPARRSPTRSSAPAGR